ncbi:cyclic nucleotide-binding domain-containing protein [Anaerolineales bacterium HSG6]|nr:cyclic nucleotide-binding domain-containing protein [Anaerolineales bacterium HSG6]
MSDIRRKDYKQELTQHLQRQSAFAELSEEALTEFVARAKYGFCEQGERVIHQGDSRREFFLVLHGQLRALDTSQTTPRLLNYHAVGTWLGLRSLLYHRPRAATVEVVSDSVVAVFDEDAWHWLYEHHPQIIERFRQIERGYDSPNLVQFPGRQADEAVVIATKRHVVALLPNLVWPLLWLVVPAIYFVISSLLQETIVGPWLNHQYLFLMATIPFISLTMLTFLYNYLDWRNDDFIVTTKRVIHIERILFYGEERHEAPLTRVQDVTIIAEGLLSKFFDYRDVAITTAGVGVIRLTSTRQAEAVKDAILQERRQATARVEAADVASLRQAIAQKLDWDEAVEQNIMAVAEAQGININQTPTRQLPGALNYLVPRIKEVAVDPYEGLTITWRKHYGILLKMVGIPLFLITLLGTMFVTSLIGGVGLGLVHLFLLIGLTASGAWYVWQYDDWHNDVYMVTPHRIVDVESSSFKTSGEVRREGTFDHIQNITYNIPSFYSKLFNVGDVTIETAGSKDTFTFEHVFNPSAVQQEIFNRMILHQQRQREQEREATTGQIIDMIGEYHHLFEKVRPPQPKPPQPNSDTDYSMLKKAA